MNIIRMAPLRFHSYGHTRRLANIAPSMEIYSEKTNQNGQTTADVYHRHHACSTAMAIIRAISFHARKTETGLDEINVKLESCIDIFVLASSGLFARLVDTKVVCIILILQMVYFFYIAVHYVSSKIVRTQGIKILTAR